MRIIEQVRMAIGVLPAPTLEAAGGELLDRGRDGLYRSSVPLTVPLLQDNGRPRIARAQHESTTMTRIQLRAACARASIVLFGAALAAHAEAACNLYEHRDFLGASLTINDNQSLAHLGSLNDRVSSIIVSPGCLLVAYADPQFAGAVTTFSAGKHALLPDGWDDEISSARCNCR
jgi:hypothetical protein